MTGPGTHDVLAGGATAKGTLRGLERFGAGGRALGRTGLTVAPVGFGGRRVRPDAPVHHRALADALRGGVNLVDTRPTDGDGGSETLVGAVLSDLARRGEIQRDEIVVVSGVAWDDEHPEGIFDLISASLQRLRLAHLDVVLLDHAGGPAPGPRWRAAFEQLERAAKSGVIGWYGVSSAGFVRAEDDPGFTPLHRLIELAATVGGPQHRFAVAQMPMNLLELGAALRSHDTPHGPRTPIELATQLGIGVLACRPLDAVHPSGQGRVRLVETPQGATAPLAAAREVLARVRKLEAQWATGLGQQLVLPDGRDNAIDLFRWGQELSAGLLEIGTMERWQHLRHDVIGPHLGQVSASLLGTLQGGMRQAFGLWWAAYGTVMHEAFSAIEAGLRSQKRDLARVVAGRLDPLLPEPWRSLPLSRKAVLTVLESAVSSVLVGMREPAYVLDVLAVREQTSRVASRGALDLAAVSAEIAQAVHPSSP
jgi:aryl-alcohol dehydrogenase-like predicted oxidoreductase